MLAQTTLEADRNSDLDLLYMAFELADQNWKVAFSRGFRMKTLVREVPARDLGRLMEVMLEVKEELGIDGQMKVCSLYEAGFDAFWLHRFLVDIGVDNHVVDAASIETNRRGRRPKTDRLDAEKLVRKRILYQMGDDDAYSVCAVPTRQDEDDRRLTREYQKLKEAKTEHTNRIKGLLKTHGLKPKVNDALIEGLDELECKDGSCLGYLEKQELRREYQRRELVCEQLNELEAEMEKRLDIDDAKSKMIRKLARLKGVGFRSAFGLVAEMFGWREFKGRDQLSSYAGYDSAPYDTGESTGKSQGISKAGNRWVRAIMHSVALNWLRWQPDSHLSQWYRENYDGASKDERKKGRVALARKLLVRLWRWVESDELPWGAIVKPAPGQAIEETN